MSHYTRCSANVSEVVSFMSILTWQVACASGGGGRKRHCWVQDIGDWRNIVGNYTLQNTIRVIFIFQPNLVTYSTILVHARFPF